MGKKQFSAYKEDGGLNNGKKSSFGRSLQNSDRYDGRYAFQDACSRLGTVVIKEALRRTGIRPEQVDEVYMGCVIQAGLGQNPARQAAVNAGIPVEVPATTINVLCGSGMHCVNLAAKLVRRSGDADIIVAGGMENMSTGSVPSV